MKELIELLETHQQGVDESAIRQAEQKLEVRFPQQYVELFQLANGPEVGEWQLFPVQDSHNEKKTWDDVVRQNSEANNVPKEFLVIGQDGTGDYVCFGVEGGQAKDAVLLWDHETEQVEKLAPSLKQFILYTTEEEGEDEEQ